MSKDRNALFTCFYLLSLLFLFPFQMTNCQDNKYFSLSDETNTFNNVLKFENYQVNHFAKNNNGDFVVSFTSSTGTPSRKFFGLKKDGQYFFSDDESHTKEIGVQMSEGTNAGLDGSKNLFVSINGNTDTQYLFSINAYNSMVELYDMNNQYYIWSFNSFFQFSTNEYYSPCSYEIFSLKKEQSYIIAFIPKEKITSDKANAIFIKKFRFKSFNENAYDQLASVTFEDFDNKKILTAFLMDGDTDDDTFVILTLTENSRRRNSNIIPPGDWLLLRRTATSYAFKMEFYNKNLGLLKEIELNAGYLAPHYKGEKLFIKSLYIDKLIVAFIYYKEGDYSFYIELFELNYIGETSNNIDSKITENIEMPYYQRFNIGVSLNDFVKINNNRLAFIYTSNSYTCILIIYIDENNKAINILDYYIDFDTYKPENQISGFSYNDHLMLSAATIKNSKPISLFMIFGYSKGTDKELDNRGLEYIQIAETNDDIFNFLIEDRTIDNNIFGYFPLRAIKFISIPEELDISIYNSESSQNHQLQLNDILCSYEYESEQENTQFCNENYGIRNSMTISQNTDIMKKTQYYYIEYQYISVEVYSNCPVTSFGSKSSDGTDVSTSSICSNYEYKTYYGRTNRLIIKLCHDYCETCNELGLDINDQKCLSCLPEFQYDFLSIFKGGEGNPGNCVPEDNYYDINYKEIKLCNSTNYFYINKDGKKICYKIEEEENPCPLTDYNHFNQETKECYKIDTTTQKPSDSTKFSTSQVEIPKTPSTQVASTKETSTSYQCDNFDNENEDNYEKIKNCEYISKYNGSTPIIITNSNGYSLQITTVRNELKILNENIQSNYSIIDLKDCADLLRSENGLNPDDDLIIIKYENDNKVSNGNEKSVQYEVYLPNNNQKLDLSVCSNTNINIYIPIELSEKTQRLYDNLKKQGYNLFDKNDDFYLKFCTIYNSLNGTDVILPDRLNIYQQNKLECQNNCEYSDYLSESKYLKCKCSVTNEEKIETKDPEKITGKAVSRTFYDVLKYSNYKVLYCYNLVFRKVTIRENLGSILSNIYFIGYLIAIGILFYTKGAYLKKEISKLLTIENADKNSSDINDKNVVIFKKDDIIEKDKIEQEKNINKKNDEKEKKNNEKINIQKKEEEDINKKINDAVNKLNNNIIKCDIGQGNGKKPRGSRNQSISQLKDTTLKDSISENKKFASKDVLSNKLAILDEKSNEIIIKNSSERNSINSKNKKESQNIDIKEITEEQKDTLSNYELNNLEYDDALELDNRNFLKIYWYLLKREHIVLFTFINWNDFNLFSIKLSKLFLAICSDMAFNVFFFSDESMHKTYETGGEHNWLGHLAQIVIATILSQILQVFVNFLTMTDIHYYELKALKRDYKINSKEAVSVIICIKIKIIAYLISTFLMFLFFWYASSAFCAVYPNTQRIFIVDSYSSFLMGLLYPFILYLFPAALRVISLKAKKSKNLKIFYSLSDKIPIF